LGSGAIIVGHKCWVRLQPVLGSTSSAYERQEGSAAVPAVVEFAQSFFPVLLLVFVLRGFVAEPYQIPSESMLPTLKVGDFILVNKYAYGLRFPVLGGKFMDVDDPARGDIMVFVPPHDPRYFIKRVIGLPGDRVRYANKTLFVNGRRLNHEFVREFTDPRLRIKVKEYIEESDGRHYPIYKSAGYEPAQEWTIGPGQYLMIGDNRDRSADSRTWGLASAENIVGKAVAIWANKPPGWQWPSFERNRWLSEATN
jgi:signal peptidase I